MSGIEKESPQNDVPFTSGENNGPISTPPVIDCDVAENAETTKRKLTSVVWNHFKKQKVDGVDKAICNYCEKKLGGSSKNGTKHLHEHFKTCLSPTIRRDIMKIYESEKTKTKNVLNTNQGRIAVTTDMWTSTNQKRGYMVVTAHYIDDLWILRNKIIRFMYVPSPHNAKTLSKELMECLVAWSIDRKLSTLTLDNCSVNISMIDKMKEKLRSEHLLLNGELLHMKCCAHILNLIVQQGLSAIKSWIETIRESVVYWTATPKRVENFEEAKDGLTFSSKRKLVLDSRTRWNSTYLMLISAIVYKDVFNRLVHTDKHYKQAPTDRDWLLAKLCEIRLLLRECLGSSYVEEMATNMIEKFDQYWSVIHGILAIATILDPRFKMKLIEYYFPKIYGDESPLEIERIRKMTFDLVKEYTLSDGKEAHSDSLQNFEVGMDVDECVDPLAGYDLFVSSTSNVDAYKSELDYYLEETVLPRNGEFDILGWWKANDLRYPTLQKVVKYILAIPVSTVASELAFSTGGRHVTPHRNGLHPHALEALVCAQDWLWDENLGAHSNREKYLAMFEDIKDEDDDAGPSHVDFGA